MARKSMLPVPIENVIAPIAIPSSRKMIADHKGYELLQVIGKEAGRKDMPILYNMNFGHTAPICILPYGIKAEIISSQRKKEGGF